MGKISKDYKREEGETIAVTRLIAINNMMRRKMPQKLGGYQESGRKIIKRTTKIKIMLHHE